MMADQSHCPSLARCIEAFFQKLEADLAGGAEVTDQHILSLSLLAGKNFTKAIQIVDEGGVKCYVGEGSGRRVYQVLGRSGADQYNVFPGHYCSCRSFQYDVVGKADTPYCKHQLAARLAQALQRCPQITVSGVALAAILLQL